MEDFSQLCHVLQSEYKARNNPFTLRDYARMSLEAFADVVSEDRPEQFHSAAGRFFASLYSANELLNVLPVESRLKLGRVTIGVPPRAVFELLNDFGQIINGLSLSEMSAMTVRASLQENGFPYRSNEFFSLLEQFGRLDWSFIDDVTQRTKAQRILNDHPNIKQRQFCRELGVADKSGGALYEVNRD